MTMANSVKVEKRKIDISGYSVKLPVRVLIIKYLYLRDLAIGLATD